MGHAFAHHYSKVRAGAGYRQQVNQGNCEKFSPIHGGSLRQWVNMRTVHYALDTTCNNL
ncbi:hypothetical protein D3C72_1375090 [compost metagenome]